MDHIPEAFIENTLNHFPLQGQEIIEAIKTGKTQRSLLFNPHKHKKPKHPLPWNNWASLITEERSLISDPLYHAGCYYSQEPSSTIVYYLIQALNLKENSNVLDLCAAPGGKSLNMLNALPERSVVVSNETHPKRNSILQEVHEKWGFSNKIILQNSAFEIGQLGELFDLALVDAPCSGEGMFRKSNHAINQWSMRLVESCARTQREIVFSAKNAIKSGGHLIYSTCTLNQHENEENAKSFLENGFEEIRPTFPKEWNVQSAEYGQYFLPGRSLGEGLYFCVFQKTGAKRDYENQCRPIRKERTITDMYTGELVKIKNAYCMLPEHMDDILGRLQGLNVKLAGTKMFNVKDKMLYPTPESLTKLSIPEVELDRESAIKYLRGESISHQLKGWVKIKNQGKNLGPAKGTGKRLNNHYPKNWRIKKAI
ncbi:MAG: hypothetical protein AAF487_09245 [Bacteroidota bacterium]